MEPFGLWLACCAAVEMLDSGVMQPLQFTFVVRLLRQAQAVEGDCYHNTQFLTDKLAYFVEF